MHRDNLSKKVFVGVSGGVDSSVALAELKNQGYDVVGVFLKVWSPDFLPCTWRGEHRSAMRVCATLDVPFMTLDCEQEYKQLVVDYMIAEYRVGRTPNPDVFCNKYVKFGVFLKKALELGADYIATGHYAQIEIQETPEGRKNYYITEAIDAEKDQSYFLCELGQHELSHALFPIGHIKKSEVRIRAKKYNLPTAEKKDSQGLCFIGKVDMKDFLKHYINTQPGNVLDIHGNTIGIHTGSQLYTIGERHGFTITHKSPEDLKLFVISKDIHQNTITVHHSISDTTHFREIHLEQVTSATNDVQNILDISLLVRFRYHQEKIPCTLKRSGGVYTVTIEKQESAIAPGQVAVFYDDNRLVGSGIVQ